MSTRSEKVEEIWRQLKSISLFSAALAEKMNGGIGGFSDIQRAKHLQKLYDMIIQLEHKGRIYTGNSPSLARIL